MLSVLGLGLAPAQPTNHTQQPIMMRDDATAGIQQGQKQPTHQETAQLVVTIVWVGLGRGLGHCLRLDWPTNHTPS